MAAFIFCLTDEQTRHESLKHWKSMPTETSKILVLSRKTSNSQALLNSRGFKDLLFLMYVVCVCLGLGSLSQAHEYLSKAEWTVMKTPGCSHTVLHQLHRSLGRLHAAMGKYASALTHFANDVSPKTCGTLLLDCMYIII